MNDSMTNFQQSLSGLMMSSIQNIAKKKKKYYIRNITKTTSNEMTVQIEMINKYNNK